MSTPLSIEACPSVTITDSELTPPLIGVVAGSSVTWTNRGGAAQPIPRPRSERARPRLGENRSAGRGRSQVLALAVRDERILLTFDKDFGALARGSALPRGCGVILLLLTMPKPRDVGQQLAQLITLRSDWAGRFSVIEPGRIQMRAL